MRLRGVRFRVPPRTFLAGLATLLAGLTLAAQPAEDPTPIGAGTPEPVDTVELLTALTTFDVVWSTVATRHFDPEHGGVDWDAVRDELRPQAALTRGPEELRAVLREMLGRLEQSHFELIPAEHLPESRAAEVDGEVAGGIGLDVRALGDELVVTRVDPDGPAARAGVRPGWVLSSVDGATAIGWFERYAHEDPRETAFRVWRKARRATYGPVGNEVDVVFVDERGDVALHTIERERRDVVPFVSHDLPTFYLSFASGIIEHAGQRIGWVRFSNWFEPTADQFDRAMERFADCDGVVIDLRGNTGGAGHLIGRVAGHFFAESVVLGRQRMRFGSFPYKTVQRDASFDRPLALVVDATTSSSSEVFAGGLQSVGRAHIVGERTAGAVLPATTRLLPNGDALLYAIADFATADGTVLEGRGVTPDEPVALSRNELLVGRDAAFERALAWIVGERARRALVLQPIEAAAR